MTTIRLQLKKSKGYLIEAKTIPSGGSSPDHRDGNLDVPDGTKISWEASPGGQDTTVYTATFRNLQNNAVAWPFVEKADGTGTAPAGYTGPLVLPFVLGGKDVSSVELTTKSPGVPVKYTVTAGPPANIDPLDPMIIIRPQSLASVNVAFGVTCAVLGAIAGALLMTWLR
jgi:hypothetical protein